MSNIYELPRQIEDALYLYYACFDEDTGELKVSEEELKLAEEQLGDLQNKKDELLQWYLQDRANKQAENAGLDAEIERLTKRKVANSKKIERVEKIIDYNFKELYKDKAIAFGNFTINYRKSKRVEIDKSYDLAEEYLTTKTSITPNKIAIKADLQAGKEIQGCKIEERQSLSIK